MRLKAARSAGALYLLSPVAVPGLTLKTRGGAHYYNDFSQSSSKGRERKPLKDRWSCEYAGQPARWAN
jgi:hypothetical protein